MSLVLQVVNATGATRAEVLRVAREGATTAADQKIAEAIEAAGGRKAADLVVGTWRAEHRRLQRALWEETKAEDRDFLAKHAAQAGITDVEPLLPAVVETRETSSASTNPNAIYDPEVTVYSEDTAPDSPNRIAPHHPRETAEDAGPTREEQAATAHADLAHLLDDNRLAARLAKKWASRISAVHQAARREVQRLLLSHSDPRIARRTAYRARQARRMALTA
ncbi:hypothetical protein [Nocardiopsis sp. NRRL B-16309]|uniref:hypothetical protein n=1 Tax=Nocardiopsis sp. NRRL B-16309 TaxID=1519494 RepID=UPI0006AFAA77|nr:hypothetical protein [Nocardiopsis sp. NRRL B-16309]